MNFTHLLYFQKAAQYHSIHKAAKELFMTPSGLSMALNNLEEELGYKLFNRSKTGLQLTPQGEEFATDVAIILNMQKRWSEISRQILMPKKITIKIAVIPAVFNSLFSKIVAETITLNSPIHPAVLEYSCHEISSALLDHRIRYAITSYNENDDKSLKIMAKNLSLDFIPLTTDTYSVFVGKQNPLYKLDACTSSMLKDFTGVSMGHDSINQFDSQRFFDQTRTLYFHNQSYLLEKIVSSTCFTILPTILCSNYLCQTGLLHSLIFDEEITPICYALICPQSKDRTDAETVFVATIQKHFNTLS